MKVPHSPLSCIWQEWIKPLLVSNCGLNCNRPEDEKLDDEMKEVLLDFALDNTDEFSQWLIYNRGRIRHPPGKPHAQLGMNKWGEYLDENAVSCETPGPIFIILTVAIPIIGVALVTMATITGIATWFKYV